MESPRKLYYARHRPTEAYFWALGVYYEPQYSKARKLLAKFIATITPYDDTFDNYGIWDELLPFADVMQRYATYVIFLKIPSVWRTNLVNKCYVYHIWVRKHTCSSSE